MTNHKTPKKNRRWWIALLILGTILVIILAILNPWNISHLASKPDPVENYAQAVQRIESLHTIESSAMNPICRLQFMTHNQKVERAIILVHGYTNCPEQFRELGQHFYDLGFNVLIAPLPHHGLADRMTEEHAQLKAEELVSYADEVADIGQGLGEQVIMLGLSGGGVTTAWAAQNRSDIDLAVIISPAFGFKQIPTPLTASVMNLYTLLPDSFEWWDPALQSKIPPDYTYPRYSKHALVQTLRLGFAIQAKAKRAKPSAQKIIIVYNANDNSVNNALTADVVKIWQGHGANISTYEFPSALKLAHDLIDPNIPNAQIEIVYPRLIELVTQQE